MRREASGDAGWRIRCLRNNLRSEGPKLYFFTFFEFPIKYRIILTSVLCNCNELKVSRKSSACDERFSLSEVSDNEIISTSRLSTTSWFFMQSRQADMYFTNASVELSGGSSDVVFTRSHAWKGCVSTRE